MVRTLGDLVAPTTTDEFLSDGGYGQSFTCFSRAAEEVEGLLSWRALNLLLSQHRLDAKRLRLVQDRSLCSRDSYTRLIPNRRGDLVERLQPAAVMGLLRAGATLILDAVDEMHSPIGHLAENLARELHEEVQVNAYASWGSDPAYGRHYDDHDAFVVQVAGQKRWQVFETERPECTVEDPQTAGATKVFDRVIGTGDVMYLPRGWVHDVVAVGKPSLHLTIGVRVRDGTHLLTWLLDQCRDEDPFDLRLPRFADAEERNRHVARLRKHFELLWESDVLQRFFDHRDAHIPSRTHFSLPWIGQEPLDQLQDTVRLRINGTTWRFLRRNGAELAIEADGGTWSLPAEAERVLRRVSAGDAVCVRELVAVGRNELAEDRVRYLLASMLRDGLLFIDGE